MTENDVSRVVLDAAIKVHSILGPGLLETVYESALAHELDLRGLSYKRQQPLPVYYDGVKLDDGFRADLVVEGIVIVEVKSMEAVPRVAYKILLTYLRVSNLRLGLMINIGESSLLDGYRRVVNKLLE